MSNFLKVSDKYAIASEKRQWMVQKSRVCTDKETKEVSTEWSSISFHSDLNQAVKELGQLMLRTSDATSCHELTESAQRISKLLNQQFASSASIQLGA